MKKSELKEMIKAAFLSEADFTNAQDDDAAPAVASMYEPVYEAEDEEYDYDDYDLNVEFKKSPDKASYEDVLYIIDSYEEEEVLNDFKAKFPEGEPISKKDYSDFAIDYIDDMSEVGFIQANWISIFDEDVFDKAGLVESEDKEESLDDILARISGTKVDPYLAEAEEEETDVTVDAEEETDGKEELANDSIVVDKKIVSLSSLPQQTRKILDTLETLRAQAEEFGDQKFITQVGNTITFFTRDFVVAGDEPTRAKVDESLEILKMRKLAGLLTEGEYTKALLREAVFKEEVEFNPNDPSTFPSPSTDKIEQMISGKTPSELLDILHDVLYEYIKINLKNISKEQHQQFLKAIFSQKKLNKIEEREVDELLNFLMDLPNFDSEYFDKLFNSEFKSFKENDNSEEVDMYGSDPYVAADYLYQYNKQFDPFEPQDKKR